MINSKLRFLCYFLLITTSSVIVSSCSEDLLDNDANTIIEQQAEVRRSDTIGPGPVGPTGDKNGFKLIMETGEFKLVNPNYDSPVPPEWDCVNEVTITWVFKR